MASPAATRPVVSAPVGAPLALTAAAGSRSGLDRAQHLGAGGRRRGRRRRGGRRSRSSWWSAPSWWSSEPVVVVVGARVVVVVGAWSSSWSAPSWWSSEPSSSWSAPSWWSSERSSSWSAPSWWSSEPSSSSVGRRRRGRRSWSSSWSMTLPLHTATRLKDPGSGCRTRRRARCGGRSGRGQRGRREHAAEAVGVRGELGAAEGHDLGRQVEGDRDERVPA